VVDLRVLNPLHCDVVVESARRTRRLLVVDGGWSCCGMAGEIIARVAEELPLNALAKIPTRITLPDAPAPTSRVLEAAYYPTAKTVADAAAKLMS
jgi:pyruvate/2-oxoglutarate/acetoin dehydrogenase E1 component